MYAVCVHFTVEPLAVSEFSKLVLRQASTSLDRETGCHQFDVCTDTQRPSEFFLYELYSDRAAFDLHLASSHFKRFDEAIRGLVLEKHVTTYDGVRQ